jgi:outer membrane protein OmpA-like peptidoglycan-associated protein
MTLRILRVGAIAVALVGALACATASNRAYDEQYEKLKQEQAAQQAMDAAAHAEAQRYAAVVYFATGSAVLDEDAQRQLRWFAEKMNPYPQATFDVQGFADSTGAEVTNQVISGQRAQACASYLASLGIAPARMQVNAFSTASPAASNASAAGRKNNRRVEITVR